MTQEELISALIGKTIGLYPTEVACLLNKNGVVIDADTLDIDQLISATFNGINTNPMFKQELSFFIEEKNITINPELEYANTTGDYIAGATALFSTVGNYLGSKDQLKAAKTEANTAINSNQTALEIARINQQTALAQLQAKTTPSNNIPLYIGLGVGGLTVIGLIVYFVTKK